MSQEDGPERTIAERALARWPSMLPRVAQSVLHLPEGSRLRSAALRKAARAAFNAWNRGDFELVPHIDDPDIETRITQGAGPPIGFDAVYYGPQGHCRSMQMWNEAWSKWDAEIEEIVEEGRDRVLILGRIKAEGAASGVGFEEWCAVRYAFRDGRIVRVDAAFDSDRARALEALAYGYANDDIAKPLE